MKEIMELRDYFAGQALVGICFHDGAHALLPDEAAFEAYKYADAMMNQREEGE